MGIDYLSVEKFGTADYPAHHALLEAGVVIVEGLDLSEVEPGEYDMTCLPLRIVGRRRLSRPRDPCAPGSKRPGARMNVLLCATWWPCCWPAGRGSGSIPLTRDRAKPAVSFGGPYRIIDFTLSNCINSGLRKIFIATQYKAQSLNRHVRMGWSVVNTRARRVRGGAAAAEAGGRELVSRHRGRRLPEPLLASSARRPRWVIVLSGDHIYKMDYGKMLDVHIARGAALTVAAIEVPVAEARRFGVLEVDEDSRVMGFQEKPETAAAHSLEPRLLPRARWASTSSTSTLLVRELQRDAEEDTSHDFGKDIIPQLVQPGERVYAYLFWDENKKESKYWRDVGTLDAYYEALDGPHPGRPRLQPLRPGLAAAHVPAAVPARQVRLLARTAGTGRATDSIVSMGCIVSGSEVRRSILCPDVRVHSFCDIAGLDPACPTCTVHRHAPHPPRHRRPRRRGAAGARSSATTPRRTGGATPCRTAAWWS